MSHIATIATEIRDQAGIVAACRRLNHEAPTIGSAVVGGVRKTGTIVKFRPWIYPVVIDLNTGAIAYDNYGGAWGDVRELDRFKQAYAVEKTKLEAKKAGYNAREKVKTDGSIELELTR
jgi:hypothetical protein